MHKDLIIYGAGGAGRELAFSLSSESHKTKKWRLTGFVDDDDSIWGQDINGIPVRGGFDWIAERGGNVAITIVGDPIQKRGLVTRLRGKNNIVFPKLIGPNSIVSEFVEWGEGCIIALAFNWISPNVKLGNFVFVNCSTRIGHDVSCPFGKRAQAKKNWRAVLARPGFSIWSTPAVWF